MFAAFENPGLWGMIAAPTYPMLRDVTRAAFLDLLAESGIRHRVHRTENWAELLDVGSLVLFRSMDNPDRMRGPNLAWAGADELTYAPWASWQEIQKRVRHEDAKRLQGFAAFTPKGFDQAFDFFAGASVGDRELIRANPFENAGHLAPGYYEELRRSFDPQLYKQEVLGEFLPLQAGQAYWAFERSQDVKDCEYDPALPLCWSLDFNVDPLSSVIAQWQPARPPAFHGQPPTLLRIRVLDEISLRGASTWQACEEFTNRWGEKHGDRALYIYGDPAGSARHTAAASESDWQLIRQYFGTTDAGRKMRPEFRVLSSAPPVKDRVQGVNARLSNAAGERFIAIDQRCKELIADLERVTWMANSTQIDKRDRARTHMSDALGYFTWREFPLRGAVGERSERLI